MVGSKDLPPSSLSFGRVFYNNQFCAKPQWPTPGTSLSGKTAVITGGNTGLGYEAALQLLDLKLSRLFLAVRLLERGEEAAEKLRRRYPAAIVNVWVLDMCSYKSVQDFVRRIDTELDHIVIALLNAGVLRMDFTKVPDTVSTVLLATLLLPVLKAKRQKSSGPTRLTIVNAALTLAATFPNRDAHPLLPSFDDPEVFAKHSRETYNTSKLLAHMFLWKLVDKVSADDVIINLADPAWCKGTNLARDAQGIMKLGVAVFGATTGRTPRVGASCFVDAIVNKGTESHGCFLMSWKIHPFAAFLYTPEGSAVIPSTLDGIDRLWEETLEELDFAGIRSMLKSL
ncbi:hypothetical protein BDP81DRAFT_507303 [Colletotrichum phormii]|uniref:Short chain dehydrogenase atnD n=1 Tax=Colletotrichum phormii TaxID=359342 RepID=A0AAI9ZDZ6_9PEZI|nr:uncharacterized protein BDP81DRAFT_507303 [Colletotrichum phormii]KAK1622691.1 hypothetical protein BDP81DRAFT_507303 [Colletotrichum phormii]